VGGSRVSGRRRRVSEVELEPEVRDIDSEAREDDDRLQQEIDDELFAHNLQVVLVLLLCNSI